MNVFDTIEEKKKEFTKNDYVIYQYITQFPEQFASHSIAETVDYLHISQAALTRFAQKIGFSGISDFQYQFVKDLEDRNSSENTTSPAAVYSRLLTECEKLFDDKSKNELGAFFDGIDHFYVCGYNLSKLPAIELTIFSIIAGSLNITYFEADCLGSIFPENSALIIYSAMRGDFFKSILDLITAEHIKPKILLVTMNKKHILRKFADKVIVLPSKPASELGRYYLADTMCFMMFNEILTSCLSDRKKSQTESNL